MSQLRLIYQNKYIKIVLL